MAEMEKWLDIVGYEGYYRISSLGRVKSLGRQIYVEQSRYDKPRKVIWKPRILKPATSKLGRNRTKCSYAKVVLRKNGVSKNYEVHRLVAKAFIPNPDRKTDVNHLDFNGLNNEVSNLEWCSKLENIMYSIHRRPKRYRSYNVKKRYFSEDDEKVLLDLFSNGVGVTAISYQLGLPYSRVRYVYRKRYSSQKIPSQKNDV
jgi:hypothetical protein